MIDAKLLTAELGGRWYGNYGTASCPVCQPERRKTQNALTLTNGNSRLLLHCKKLSCNFHEILEATSITSGTFATISSEKIAQREAFVNAEAAKRSKQAEHLFEEALPITGSIAETYLRSRGLSCELPPSLRFHPEAWHGATARRIPAMLAIIEGSDGFAVHRTYLKKDGTGKANIEPAKTMLGPSSGGAVQLVNQSNVLVVAEGIETALSLCCGLLEGSNSIWAALSTSGLRSIRLPPNISKLVIAPDADDAGLASANALAERAFSQGLEVSLHTPPRGLDWNGVLMSKEHAHAER